MGMNGRLLRPLASGHPDAMSWRSRVIANGGTVSASTMTAVTAFCKSIDAAGIRDRMWRTNLFCGSTLSAAIVPLYRGPSLSGTQYGNSTDTNNNFVSGDYVETGSSGGLTRSATGKTLSTGITPANAPVLGTGHLATSVISGSFTAAGFAVDFGQNLAYRANHYVNTTNANQQFFGSFEDVNASVSQSTSVANGLYSRWLITRTSTSLATLYRNAASVATRTATATQTSNTTQLTIFGSSGGGAGVGLHYYSLGDGLTASQVSAFDAALSSFLSAMGRV